MKVKLILDKKEYEFDSEEIEKIEEMEALGDKAIFVYLKNGSKVFLPISKKDFENKLAEGKEIIIKIDL